jgi:subtilase family serine protease
VVGRLAGSTPIDFDVALAPRDPVALERFVEAVSTPGSPSYRHYLRPGAFGPRFGPSVATLDAVVRALHQLGLATGAASSDRILVPVRTTVAGVEHAFHTSIEQFHLATGRLAFGNASAPLLPRAIAPDVTAIVGLSDVAQLQAGGAFRARSPIPLRGQRTSLSAHQPLRDTAGPTPCSAAKSGAASADVIASAYALGGLYSLGNLGQGETIGLFEPASFASSDIAAYQHCYRTNTSVTVIPVDGGGGPVGYGTLEVTSDIEDLLGLAPRAKILVYETSNNFTPDWVDDWARIVDDDSAQVISTSWLSCESEEPVGFAATEETFFEQAATQGETVLAASGDYGSEGCDQQTGATTLSVDDPASDPYVTGVGGTEWSSVAPRSDETTWNSSSGGGASGGGLSSDWPMPTWQTGPGVINSFSTGTPCGNTKGDCREVPDVAALSGPPYYSFYCSAGDCSDIKGWGWFYGTSFATPVWAASVALSNESCPSKPPAGFLDPALYTIAASLAPPVFNDMTTGNNDYTGTNSGKYPATTGYDLATGLGTPIWSSSPTVGLAASLCGLSTLPTPPTVSVLSPDNVYLPSTTIPVVYSGSDAASSVSSYDVRYDVEPWDSRYPTPYRYPGDWQSTTSARESLPGVPGSAYCVGARATSSTDVTSFWTSDACAYLPLGEVSLHATAPHEWTRDHAAGYYLDAYATTTEQGATLQVAGAWTNQIAIVAARCPGCGTVDVYINGKLLGHIDTYGQQLRPNVVFVCPAFPYGRVTVSLKSASAHRRVIIEGVGVA